MQTLVHDVEEERVMEEKKNKVPGEYHSVSVMVIILLTREGEGEGDECGICRITFGIIVKVITHYLRNTSFPLMRRYRYWDGISVAYFIVTQMETYTNSRFFSWFFCWSYTTAR